MVEVQTGRGGDGVEMDFLIREGSVSHGCWVNHNLNRGVSIHDNRLILSFVAQLPDASMNTARPCG